MTFCEWGFKAIDVIFDIPQNCHKNYKDKNKSIKIEKDIVYNEEFPKHCILDTYHIPKENGKYPVMLYIHGGGFEAGDKKCRRGISKWYAKQGLFVVNINYALSPKYKYPEHAINCTQAFNWIIDNAEKYNLDTTKIVVSGDSGGGYLSLAVAGIADNADLRKKLGVEIKGKPAALILDCGIYDLRLGFIERRLPFALNLKMVKEFVGVSHQIFYDHDINTIANPIDFVSSTFPPTFVSYSKHDIFCKGQGELLIEKLKENNVYYEEFMAKRWYNNHCFPVNGTTKEALENDRLTEDFLKRFLEAELMQKAE